MATTRVLGNHLPERLCAGCRVTIENCQNAALLHEVLGGIARANLLELVVVRRPEKGERWVSAPVLVPVTIRYNDTCIER